MGGFINQTSTSMSFEMNTAHSIAVAGPVPGALLLVGRIAARCFPALLLAAAAPAFPAPPWPAEVVQRLDVHQKRRRQTWSS